MTPSNTMDKLTAFEKITARRRSTDPHCWTCKTYPNCNMCARKPSLRGQPKRQLTPEQKQACRKIIKTASPLNPTITPQTARVKAEIAKQLELIGILTLVKKAEYPCKYLYKLNTTHSLQSAYPSVRSIPDLYRDMRLGKERRIRDLLRPIPNGKIISNMESTRKLLRELMYFDEYERDILRKWFDDIGRK